MAKSHDAALSLGMQCVGARRRETRRRGRSGVCSKTYASKLQNEMKVTFGADELVAFFAKFSEPAIEELCDSSYRMV